jgi:hypothetical protein
MSLPDLANDGSRFCRLGKIRIALEDRRDHGSCLVLPAGLRESNAQSEPKTGILRCLRNGLAEGADSEIVGPLLHVDEAERVADFRAIGLCLFGCSRECKRRLEVSSLFGINPGEVVRGNG